MGCYDEPYALLCTIMYPQPFALVQSLFPALPLVLLREGLETRCRKKLYTVAKNFANTELYRKVYALVYIILGKRRTHSQKNLGPKIFSMILLPWAHGRELHNL